MLRYGEQMGSIIDGPSPNDLCAEIGLEFSTSLNPGRVRYASLLEAIRTPRDVALDVAEQSPGEWIVAICTADFLGALSIIVGLLSAYRLSIINADLLTVSYTDQPGEVRRNRRGFSKRTGPLEASPPSRRILDVFDVRALDPQPPDLWPRFHADLMRLLADDNLENAKDDVIGRVSEWFRTIDSENAKLFPVSIDLSNPPASSSTRMTVRSADTPGFLFAFANALAGLALNVERAEVRTVNGEAWDTFWVTDVQRRQIVDEKRVHELRVATTLVKQFTYLLPRSPNPGQAMRQFNALISQMLSRADWTAQLSSLESPVVLQSLADLMGVSRFLWEDFLRLQHESLFPLLLDVQVVARTRTRDDLRNELRQRLHDARSHAERVDVLNEFKDREMFRIDLHHIVGRTEFSTFSQELTWLAEVSVEFAAELALDELFPKHGRPILPDGRPCPWSICALGKFGGQEIGFGSDLEVIFVFEGEGVTDGFSPILASEYFAGVVQTFLRNLRARQEGVFEVDLRLRPFGKAGALASSLDGFSSYYSAGGFSEPFERLALVRLRPIAGDPELGERIRSARDAFVFSAQPLDVENILHLRRRQATELVPRGQVNVKYSSGGVADLEYFVQAWQISVGVSDATVRVTNTLEAIRRLTRGGYLPESLAQDLQLTYDFLRRLIDALRVVRGNAKDLTIPPEDTREFAFLARRLRLSDPSMLHDAIATRMKFARNLWTLAPPRASTDRSG